MRTGLSLCLLSVCICSTVTGPARAASYKLLYSFQGGADGSWPTAGLINVGGTLYGTTEQGGITNCKSQSGLPLGCGTVYSIMPAGQETVLYRFQAGNDGADPRAPLIYADDMFYGTTLFGAGDIGCGTLFSLTPHGQEHQIYTFPAANNGADGCGPGGPLLQVHGRFYGTTLEGGIGAGTAFEISKTGTERVLLNFAGLIKGMPNGQSPSGGFINVGDTLYSTTLGGGLGNDGNAHCYTWVDPYHWPVACGVVFSISRGGKERIVHFFQPNGNDAAEPWSGLVSIDGTFYGTGYAGGTNSYGAVYSIAPDGKEKVIYSFKGAKFGDGAMPVAALIAVGDVLYGTTEYGGIESCNGIPVAGCGTVFSVTRDGKETVLYSFKAGNDGALPVGSLLNVNGTLFGTTIAAGAIGGGTVFTVTP